MTGEDLAVVADPGVHDHGVGPDVAVAADERFTGDRRVREDDASADLRPRRCRSSRVDDLDPGFHEPGALLEALSSCA
jgi:hypothetical protein